MWNYVQETGEFLHEREHVSFGYAGRGQGKNYPAMQSAKGVGPLPCGIYRADKEPADHPHSVGKYAIELTPDPANEMYGRSSFFLHGDSVQNPGEASHGCIVQALAVRMKFWASGDHMIRVVARPEDLA